MIVSCCIDLATALLSSENGRFPFFQPHFAMTLIVWEKLSTYPAQKYQCQWSVLVCEDGWAASKWEWSIFSEKSLTQHSSSVLSVQPGALLLLYYSSVIIALLAANLTRRLPSVFTRQLVSLLPFSFSLPLPRLPRSFQAPCPSPDPCGVTGRAVWAGCVLCPSLDLRRAPVIVFPLWNCCTWSLGVTSDLLSCRRIGSVISRRWSQSKLHWKFKWQFMQVASMHSREY